MRVIGVLMAHAEADPEFVAYLATFREGLRELGWREGRNIRIHTCWGALDDAVARQRFAKELVALEPEVIITQNTPPTASMLEQTRTIPVVFVIVADPVGSGFVETLARPGLNATGFTVMEPTIAGKWLELLKEIAPHVKRAAFLFKPRTAPFAPYYVKSYGSSQRDHFRVAAYYIDRILRGAKPSELPVQAPVKFELVINLKTAKALGLEVPVHLQQRADEVIE